MQLPRLLADVSTHALRPDADVRAAITWGHTFFTESFRVLLSTAVSSERSSAISPASSGSCSVLQRMQVQMGHTADCCADLCAQCFEAQQDNVSIRLNTLLGKHQASTSMVLAANKSYPSWPGRPQRTWSLTLRQTACLTVTPVGGHSAITVWTDLANAS